MQNDEVNVPRIIAEAENERLRAELAKWKNYTGCDNPLEAAHKLDPYDNHYAGLYHRIRSLFMAHEDADGNRLGWGDYGDPMPTLLKVLAAAGCKLREGQTLPDNRYGDEAHKARFFDLWVEVHRTLPLMDSIPLTEEGSVFYEMWLDALHKDDK